MNVTDPSDTICSAPTNPLVAARTACKRIAPLWPLQNFVAVNPFLGLTDRHFVDACELIRKVAPGGMQMASAFYGEKLAEGAIRESDFAAAHHEAAQTLPEAWAQALPASGHKAVDTLPTDTAAERLLTVAEAVDHLHGTTWERTIADTIAQFCAGYYDAGQSAWRLPWRSLPLFSAWRAMASLDANLEILGLPNFRSRVKSLPDDAAEVIALVSASMLPAESDCTNVFHRQLMSIRGWAGYVQYRVRENGMVGREDDSLLQLLAIRMIYDAALLAQFDSPVLREFWPVTPESVPADNPAVLGSYVWQLAHENAWQRELFGIVRSAKTQAPSGRPAVQAVFCIDVRSEVLRRALEATRPNVETIGFAGFFGLPMEFIPFGRHHGSSHCPVLLTPKIRIREALRHSSADQHQAAIKKQRLAKRLTHSWNSFKTSAISCFSFVETAGLAFGPKIYRDAFAPTSKLPATHDPLGPTLVPGDTDSTGIALDDRVQLALGALRNMGLTTNFARLVLLCGHGSETTNNPYGSGLDCGACGGHAGDANARVGAAILNDPAVRAALTTHGITIPDDTFVVAGLHNTTTDDVRLFDIDEVPTSHQADLAELQNNLKSAAQSARRERAPRLGLDPSTPNLDTQVIARSLDWAQVRPEWGLAGNGAFIAAPRTRTRTANLEGRVFLHNYDHRNDPDSSTLELIMIAPMVVANWINLQYYASTVNNAVFGSGNKVTHNVVGTIGVCQGNSGDLQPGLPMQSVHDGKTWVHEPLRLHVLIEAPRERITAVLEKHENVRQLVDNGWLRLFAIEHDGSTYHRYLPGLRWEEVLAPE